MQNIQENMQKNMQKNNLYTELLVSNDNDSMLETGQNQTIGLNETIQVNPNLSITNEEIFDKYIKLKNKINLFWNKIG